MKKLLTTISMLFIGITLTACGGNSNLDALELLELSHEAQADISSMIMEMDAEISMSMPGVSIDMPMTIRLEMENEERTRLEMNMSMMGEVLLDTTVFVRDGYQYTEMELFGEVVREREEAHGVDEVLEMAGMFDTHALSESMIEDSSASSTDNGYRLAFTLNMDGVNSLLGDMEMLDEMGVFDFDHDQNEESDVIMVVYIDEDHMPVSSELTMNLEMVIEGITTTMEMVMTMTTVQIGNVTIDFPDWLDEISNEVPGEPVAEADLIGIWEWDQEDYVYVFEADGTGFRGFLSDEFSEFTWEIEDGNILHLDLDFMDEIFAVTLEGDVLTLLNLENDLEFSYLRTDESILDVEEPEPEIEDEDEEDEEAETAEEVSREFRNALSSGRNYLRLMSFSFESLSSQLEFEGYSSEAIAWAMAQIDAETDWYEQAVQSAENYLDLMSFSPSSLVDQLVFEGFTISQAEHAVEIAFD